MRSSKSLKLDKSHIISAMVNHLWAIRAIPSNKDVLDIEFGDTTGQMIPIKIVYKRDDTPAIKGVGRRVKVKIYDG